jgi:enoyl-CoA hydratase
MVGIDFNVDRLGIGVLSINRPHVRNALNWSAMQAFADVIEKAHVLQELRALIITGVGNTFVSGGDLNELQHYPTRSDGLRLATIMGEALKRLEALPCPTVAAINGPARGGGAEIAIACDLRTIAEDADIGFVHTRIGIIPAWGGGQRLLRVVGFARALELITTGRVLSGKEAVVLGVANVLTPVGNALMQAKEICRQIASNPPAAVMAAKRALSYGQALPQDEALEAERAEFPALWDTDFRRAAVNRFLTKNESTKSNNQGKEVIEETRIQLDLKSA